MAKKKQENKLKLNKWVKVLVWIIGIVLGLFLFFLIGFKVWVSTWQTYRNDEFGFSFKYPKNWYINGNPISKDIFQANKGIFWISPMLKAQIIDQDVVRSKGDVQVVIRSKPTNYIQNQLDYAKRYGFIYEKVKYGERYGYTRFIDISSGRYDSKPKEILVETNDYIYKIDTNIPGTKRGVFDFASKCYYQLISSSILNSFRFD